MFVFKAGVVGSAAIADLIEAAGVAVVRGDVGAYDGLR